MPDSPESIRKIIHIDCDCFFASVEMLDNPKLTGTPFAVGGSPNKRGVIATCSYEARQFGIHSAMASAHAKRLCTQLRIIPPRIERYKEVSQQIQHIFSQYTDQIEPLSLDEAYLDVSDQQQHQGSATRMAQAIRQQIHQSIGITVSAGIAPNKLLAKIASDWNKPNNLFVLTPDAVTAFMKPLPIDKLPGVGRATQNKLNTLGIYKCEDTLRYSPADLQQHLGSFGFRLHSLAQGIDDRPVKRNEFKKSLSVEHTYNSDLSDLQHCLAQLPGLRKQLLKRLNPQKEPQPISKAFVKIKFSDFTQTTAECCSQDPQPFTFQQLCREAYNRGQKPVRLIGLGLRFEKFHHAPQQLQLGFDHHATLPA